MVSKTAEELVAAILRETDIDWLDEPRTIPIIQTALEAHAICAGELVLNAISQHVGSLHQKAGSWVTNNQASYVEASIRDLDITAIVNRGVA